MFCGQACAPLTGPTGKYAATKSKMTRKPRREPLHNSANTKRYVAKLLAVCGLTAHGAAVWLQLRGGSHERDATTDASVHVVPRQTVSPFRAVMRWRQSVREWHFE